MSWPDAFALVGTTLVVVAGVCFMLWLMGRD